MAANAPPKTSKETWRDWFPDEPAKYTVDELLALVNRDDVALDLSTLRYWQKEGILPYPNRRKIGTGTHAVYPRIATAFIGYIRSMQEAGLTLKEIKPRIRGLLATTHNPDPFGIESAIIQAARKQEELFGVPVEWVTVTFSNSQGIDASIVVPTPK